MRLTRFAVLASLAALAACQDAPVTSVDPSEAGLYDLSKVTILKPDQYAAHGITQPALPKQPSMLIAPEEPCYDVCPEPEPYTPPRAYLDYYTSSTKTNNGYNKTIELWSYSQAHNNMESMVLRLSYQSVGAQGWKGCGATPAQFDSDYLVAFGSPKELRGSRYASYSSGMAFVWRITGQHTFTAQYGYVVYGYDRSRTFSSSHTACW